ncbi:ATP-binding protein [Rhodohalobacter sp.]|uniref:ATP-binding protein n=1 Tax=Rhodohalobacter sp. TaxID=1974210 RepID=UPI002ACD7394|nr:ATP-binding protein [Rhodohalobacter sp.]MDZ7755048.1 ATP-binding protein [Rhodohalobacter sp.]
MNKKELILTNHDMLLEAMLKKDEQTLRELIHPDASVFGSAISEFEKGIDRIIHYYTQSIALLPDDRRIEVKWRNFSDLGNQALVEQEFIVRFTLEHEEITLLTLRQSAIWTLVKDDNNPEGKWLLLHDHTSMPDHLGAFETISSNEMLENNLNLELETDQLKKRLRKSVDELRIAQSQLVQKERLASIGQLTAGIAHEIKNPLNFVNNFSEVIFELINEAREEVKSSGEKAKSGAERMCNSDLVLGILNDIESNLDRIYEHSKRADSILKSMLLLSRGKSGKSIPTDVNAMIDEYLKLAYHGMRATDLSFNIDIKTSYDPEMPKLDLIPQDISRAFLNIINNAMYAAYEYAKNNSTRSPVIQVSTSASNGRAEIKIRDNGGGIPDEIREKIFQPFFTTKPSGIGTGLGLSMTNDIVKMHKGTLNVDSDTGQFTEFTISLPVNN